MKCLKVYFRSTWCSLLKYARSWRLDIVFMWCFREKIEISHVRTWKSSSCWPKTTAIIEIFVLKVRSTKCHRTILYSQDFTVPLYKIIEKPVFSVKISTQNGGGYVYEYRRKIFTKIHPFTCSFEKLGVQYRLQNRPTLMYTDLESGIFLGYTHFSA